MNYQILDEISEQLEPEDIISRILLTRGISEQDQIIFLNPPKLDNISFSNLGIDKKIVDKSIKKILKAYKDKSSIVLYGDYDVDGIASSAILWITMHELGYNVMPYIPNRVSEGYGFSDAGIKNMLAKYLPRLVIAVDHGITTQNYIDKLKKDGIDTIVIDHHEAIHGIPKSAAACLHSTKISAAGLVYIFAKTLLNIHKQEGIVNGFLYARLKAFFDTDFIALAGMASITDIMSQRGYARAFAYHGSRKMRDIKNYGLRELISIAGIENKQIYGSYEMGFILGPRINAAGRIGSALDSLRLLCAKSQAHAKHFAKMLHSANISRQKKMKEQMAMAQASITPDPEDRAVFVSSNVFDEGIVGLIAGKFASQFYKPAFVGVEKNGMIFGSARSIEGIDLSELLYKLRKYLVSYGGHALAAGFSLKLSNKQEFVNAIQMSLSNISSDIFNRMMRIDMAMPLSNATSGLVKTLAMLEPFGKDNEEPIFLSKEVEINNVKFVGKQQNHVQLLIKDSSIQKPIKSIYFDGKKRIESLAKQDYYTIVFRLKHDDWSGRPQAVIRDILPVSLKN